MRVEAEFPEKLNFLFHPYNYKVARGGRGSSKSWSFARALLLMGVQRPLRILCTREFQDSIKLSVHQLLKDQIGLLGLNAHYDVFESTIIGKNGTQFSFAGLSTMTITSIKSYEGVDICWVEEGQAVSKRSLDILDPTIRKPGSEIWVSYNPDLETDPIHQFLTINPPKGTVNVEMNWRDNPWFTERLEAKRLHCKKYAPDDYDNIWEGKCRPAVEGAIFYKQMQQVIDQGRVRDVPYDPMLKVQLVFDVGYGDALGCALVQKLSSEIRIIEYLEANRTDWVTYSAELKTRPYNWGQVWLPHDAFSKRIESGGLSSSDILIAQGWDVVPREAITELSIEDGIRNARLKFPQLYFDEGKTAAQKALVPTVPGFKATSLNGRLVEAVKRYRRSINQKTEVIGAPIRSIYAHAADVVRYIAANADNMSNETADLIDVSQFNRAIMPVNQSQGAWMAS